MKEVLESSQKRRAGMILISIFGLLVIIVGVSYAWFSLTFHGTKTQMIKTGNLELTLEESASEGISLTNAIPLTDQSGLKLTPYTFTLKNTGTMTIQYNLKLVDQAISGTRMPDNIIKYYLSKNGGSTLISLLSSAMDRTLDTGFLQAGESVSYELKIWIDYSAGNEIQGTQFLAKLVAEGTQLVSTPASCFEFDESTGAITRYLCGTKIWNGSSLVDATAGLLPEGIDSPITNVVIPKTINGVAVTKIGNPNNSTGSYVFSELGTGMGITSVVIPDTVSIIEPNAFAYNQLTSVVIPNSVTSIEPGAFYQNQLTSVTIPNSVTTIGDAAFYGNNLTSVVIPDSVTSIGMHVFNDNQLPDNQAFIYARNSDGTEDKTTIISYGGAKRDNVVIPEGVTTITRAAFYGNNLTSVTISSGVTTIGIDAFSLNQLTNVVIPSSVIVIEDIAFNNNQLTSVIIQGKSSSADFISYPSSTPFGWASGYSDDNITWNG